MTASSVPPSDAPRHGSCLCGAVQVTLAGVPTDVTLCHCTTCQKSGGGAFMAAVGARLGQVTLEDTAGTLTYWRSGPATRRSFCGRCGTPIAFHQDDVERDRITVWRGLFDDPAGLVPTGQIWTDSRPDWVCRIDGLPGWPSHARLP